MDQALRAAAAECDTKDARIRELEGIIAAMVVECDENMPAKAAWLARRSGIGCSPPSDSGKPV